MAIFTRMLPDPAPDRTPESGEHRMARLKWPIGGSTLWWAI